MSEQKDPELVVTDLHRRVTGVSATVRNLIPYIAPKERLALVSQHPHVTTKSMGLGRALRICLRPPKEKPFRIWHARRNNEMIWGLVFKHLFRCRLKLVMTSCTLRRHSWFPRQLRAAMDGIIVTSREAAEYIDQPVVAVIPHGVDCNRFRPVVSKTTPMREFGIPGSFGIGICGRVRPEKGTDLFVDAMIRLLPRFPEFTACIAGLASLEFEAFQRGLKRKVMAAGLEDRILWMGEIDYERMPQFHAAMSLCVAPARYEGFGLVPLEAMACGVPVVASRTGCYPDAIIPGENGELFPCGDLEALVSALERMMSQPARLPKMGAAGCRRVNELFSAELEARRIVDVYHQLWSDAA
jgi:mannosyltransferase